MTRIAGIIDIFEKETIQEQAIPSRLEVEQAVKRLEIDYEQALKVINRMRQVCRSLIHSKVRYGPITEQELHWHLKDVDNIAEIYLAQTRDLLRVMTLEYYENGTGI